MSFVGNILKAGGQIAKGLPIVGGIITGIEQQNQAGKINPVDTTYTANPEAKAILTYTKSLLNAQMPGVTTATRGIATNTADTVANINANATSGAQALALAAGAQGTANNATLQLGTQEQQLRQQQEAAVREAQRIVIGEGDKVYQDQIRKFNNATNQKNQLQSAGQTNVANGFNQAAQLALTAFTGMSPTGNGTTTPKFGMPG